MARFTVLVNGEARAVDVPPGTPLLWVLRDTLGLTGTKFGCGLGQCGACTVHLGGAAVRACLTPVSSVGTQAVTTIEGLAAAPRWQPLFEAWLAEDTPQCGYCQPGQIMSAAALLHRTPRPSAPQVDEAMSGNICRCGTYQRIRQAIARAAAARTR